MWHHPTNDHSVRCLAELRGILNDSQRWGLLIVEGFSITNFATSIFITICLCCLIGMAADDLGRTTGGSLRASFIALLAQVLFLGLLPHPTCRDLVREELTHRLATSGLCILAALFFDAVGHMVNDVLRWSFYACDMIVLLWGLIAPSTTTIVDREDITPATNRD
jgi:hypothetical protein